MKDIFQRHNLPPALLKLSKDVEAIAKEYGLTTLPVKFVLVSPSELNALAAYTGFPTRMPHWTYGMEYENIHKQYQYGVSKIYEMVINTDPVIAYLLDTNAFVDQKLVMIHVYGHADFFKNNRWFHFTNRQMMDQMANNASRVKRIAQKRGESTVDDFIDICLTLENLIDPYLNHIKKYPVSNTEDELPNIPIPKLKSSDYMDRYINTKEFVEAQRKKLEAERQQRKKFPEHPERDILGFLVEHAPIDQWQRDLLAMVREEAYYFAPQRMTKIMNEGWATYIHSKFMTSKLVDDSDVIDYCDSQSRAIHMGESLNPYRLGLALFKNIEERWDRGQFGFEWEMCDDLVKRHTWDKKLGLGKQKIFEVRRDHNDLTFIDAFLTPEFCVEEKLFTYKPTGHGTVEAKQEFSAIKRKLLSQLANGGSPVIQIIDANHENRRELLLQHEHADRELNITKARATLENLFKIWTRPVHLLTIETDDNDVKQHDILMSFDGQDHSKSVVK